MPRNRALSAPSGPRRTTRGGGGVASQVPPWHAAARRVRRGHVQPVCCPYLALSPL